MENDFNGLDELEDFEEKECRYEVWIIGLNSNKDVLQEYQINSFSDIHEACTYASGICESDIAKYKFSNNVKRVNVEVNFAIDSEDTIGNEGTVFRTEILL